MNTIVTHNKAPVTVCLPERPDGSLEKPVIGNVFALDPMIHRLEISAA